MPNKKKALVLTYHVKNCTRIGGFHLFIDFLCQAGYDVDWVPVTMSSTWIIAHNDKENLRNFIELCKGIQFEQHESLVRHFSVPVWIPAKIAKMLKMPLGNHYWPKWKKLRKRLADSYDVILVEGTACQYADDLKTAFPQSKIIYRPSDILCMFSDVPSPELIEKRMIEVADVTLCVDELCLSYYKGISGEDSRLSILRNPITTDEDIENAKNWIPQSSEEPLVVYLGVSYIDKDIVEYTAERNRSAKFVIIGPSGESHDNVIYTGPLKESEFIGYLEKACIGISPLRNDMIHEEKGISIGYTRKIIKYMRYLMPIVATCSENYLNIDGFFCVNSKEEFSEKVSDCLKYTIDDREKLRKAYLYAMSVFSENESRKEFLSFLK
ncbi:MAG: hypothetical protein K6F79_00205 [Saccharofermentans sp.]|nr:hypothetical protein [Saccharofermentans sp.]